MTLSTTVPLNTTHHAAHTCMCISTLVPEGVLCTVGMPMFELCLQPPPNLHHAHCANSQIPTYTHWPSHPSMVGAPLCAHHTPSPSIFPAPRCCHTCSKSGHIATLGCSCPPLSP